LENIIQPVSVAAMTAANAGTMNRRIVREAKKERIGSLA
jgi:hypothetical protein